MRSWMLSLWLGCVSLAIAADDKGSTTKAPTDVAKNAKEAAGKDPATPTPLAHNFGFLDPEIYKLDFRTKNLLVRDLNGDGKMDLIIVNNLKNRIDVLEQRGDKDAKDDVSTHREVNEIVSDARLKHVKVTTTKTVASLEARDVNGDGETDLVYLTDPAGLTVEYQDENGKFTKQRRFDIEDAQQNAWSLDIGDLNGDGRNDIAFLGNENLYIVFQTKDGRLEDPIKYRLDDKTPSLIRVLDVDGDGKNDVVYISKDEQFPVRVRFQNAAHHIGPERRFTIDRSRGISYADMDGKPGQEMLVISDLSDRFHVYGLRDAVKDEESLNTQLVVYPFEKSGANAQVDLVVCDVDGDKLVDVVTSDSSAARFYLFRHTKDIGLDLGKSFPSLGSTSILRAVDIDKDGKDEIFSLSDREEAIGISKFEDQRISFPRLLPTKGQPVVMEYEIGSGKEPSRLVYLAKQTDAKTNSDKFFLRAMRPKAGGSTFEWEPAKLGDSEELAIDMQGRPFDLRAVDINADGRQDLMFFFVFDNPIVWIADAKGSFEAANSSLRGSIGKASPANVYFGPLKTPKPELIIGQGSYARSVRLDDGRLQVVDQYNLGDSNGKVQGVSAIDIDGDGKRELALYDRSAEAIDFLREKEGLYQRWKQQKIGGFQLRGIRVADFDHNGKADLLLFDSDRMGIIYAEKRDQEMKSIAQYESDIRGGKLYDMVPGDLNHDGKTDVLLLEPQRHNLEIVTMGADEQLKRAQRWKVFEEKTFQRSATASAIEPREAVIGDVDNDGREDIILLVHDRVLVYLQDAGEPVKKEDEKKDDAKTKKENKKK